MSGASRSSSATPEERGAAGGSGHGFKLGLGIGEALAQVILTGKSDIDIRPLRFTRFHEGKALPSSYKGGGNRA